MADQKVVDEWLEKADEDYGFAKTALADEYQFFAQICYHFHQAAEKYLKAYIVKFGLEFFKTHNLKKLWKICQKRNKDFLEIKEECWRINPLWMDTRYPTYWAGKYTKEDAVQAREDVEKIRDFVREKIK